jgi:hypothetical protein
MASEPLSYDLFRSAGLSAMHLEMRGAYTPDDPDWLQWRAGDHGRFKIMRLAPVFDAVARTWLMARADLPGDDGTGHDRRLPGSSPADDDLADRRQPLAQIRIDSKTVRGAKDPDGSQVHLLAAMAGEAEVVAAQTDVDAKTNEIPMIIPLLDGLGQPQHGQTLHR